MNIPKAVESVEELAAAAVAETAEGLVRVER
jgi:hypothetical protein